MLNENLLIAGESGTVKPATTGSLSLEIEVDKTYNRVLDKLILYLRVVHSIDFYNSIEYQQEDSMPNRCGIIFARPALPVNAASASLKYSPDEIGQYIQQFEAKMKPYLEFKEKLEADTAKKLGIKDRKEEVEKFIKTNTQELAADRWLCPLSGKKFKGPEFIRKHLFYKHMDKINEVKKEVEYFNNYVQDPKRPQLPEHQSNKPAATTGQQGMIANSNYQAASGYGQMNNSNYSSNALVSPMMGQMSGYGGGGGMQNRNITPVGAGWQSTGYGMGDSMMQSPGYAANFNNPGYSGGMPGQYGYKKQQTSYPMNRGRG